MKRIDSNTDTWFVKINGKIQGPFTLAVLESMRSRGRLVSGTPIARDRQHWISASDVPDLFAAHEDRSATESGHSFGSCPVDSKGMGNEPPIPVAQLRWYYSIDGTEFGPVALAELQVCADAGQLTVTDYVCPEQGSEWIPANRVTDLRFHSASRATHHFLRSRAALVAAIAGMIALLLGLPTWYVLALSREREAEIAVVKAAEKAAADRLLLHKQEMERLEYQLKIAQQSSQRSNHEISTSGGRFDDPAPIRKWDAAIAKILFAVPAYIAGTEKTESSGEGLLNYFRDGLKDIGKGVAAAAGSAGIESAVNDVFPELKRKHIQDVARVIESGLRGELDGRNYAASEEKDRVIDLLRREGVDTDTIGTIADFVLKVYEARQARLYAGPF